MFISERGIRYISKCILVFLVYHEILRFYFSSALVPCCLFLVSVLVTFPSCLYRLFLFWFRLLSGHLLGKNCSLGRPYFLFVFCLFVILVISYFGFEGGIWVLIAQFLDISYLLPLCFRVRCNTFPSFVHFASV